MAATAALPLEGGREGATVRLHPLLTGEILAPPGLTARDSGPLWRLKGLGVGVPKSECSWIPVPAFLIEHPSAGAVLVDTGLHPAAVQEPRARMGRIANRLYEFRIEDDQKLPAALAARGVDPGDLAAIVMTHLHSDHASGLSEFPGTRVVVDADELRAARRPDGFRFGYYRRHIEQPVEWLTVGTGGPAARSYSAFDRTLDLFGDSSVRLVATRGHSHGHQSVLVRLRDREALLTADAAYTRRAISDTELPGVVQNEREFRRSLAQIQSYVAQSPDALVVPGHDAEAWPALDPVYE